MLVLYFGSGACCLSSTTLCHNNGMKMGKCMLIGVIHMFNYWTNLYRLSDNFQSLVSYFWGVSDVLKLLRAACKLLPLNSGMRFCAKWRKSLIDGKWCWTVCLTKLVPFSFAYLIFFLPIFNNIDLNVCLKDVHVHQWNAPYCVGVHSQYVSSQQTVLLSWSHSKVKS